MKLRDCLTDITPYVPGKLKKGAIKLASNENVLGPAKSVIKKIKKYAKNVHIYPDTNCKVLKNKLAQKYSLRSEQFIFGNGTDEVLLFIAGAYMEQGLNAVTAKVTFSEYTFATKLFSGKMKYAALKNGKFDLNEIENQIDEMTRIIFICNPNNPTGTYLTDNELSQFINNIPKDILIVIDEAYNEYAEAKDFPNSIEYLNSYNNVIVLRTFSKIYGLAGLRIGYGISSPQIIADMHKTKEPFNVNIIAQEAAITALDDEEHVKKSQQMNEEGKHFIYKELDKLNIQYYPSQANFVFFYVNRDCKQLFEELMDMGVTVRPMKAFNTDCIRITVGTKEHNQKFISLLKNALS